MPHQVPQELRAHLTLRTSQATVLQVMPVPQVQVLRQVLTDSRVQAETSKENN